MMILAELRTATVRGHEVAYYEAGSWNERRVLLIPGWVGTPPLALASELAKQFHVFLVRQPGYSPTPAIPGLDSWESRVEWHFDVLGALKLIPDLIVSQSAGSYISEPLAQEMKDAELAQFEPMFQGMRDVRSFVLRWMIRTATANRMTGEAIIKSVPALVSLIQGAAHVPFDRRWKFLEGMDLDTTLALARIVRDKSFGLEEIRGGLLVTAHRESLIRHRFIRRLVQAKGLVTERIQGTHFLPKDGQKVLGELIGKHFSGLIRGSQTHVSSPRIL